MLSIESISRTFFASLRSVGTAGAMAGVGVYLHRTGSIGAEGKRTLAIISQQVTVPLFLFTKIIYCNQDWSDAPCPDVRRSLADGWMLLVWPAYVVLVGLGIGLVVANVCGTPKQHFRSVLAACAFGNSTGLAITLLNVIHANAPPDSDLGRIDPTLFLSVYLLLYPVLLWGLGGLLLAPVPDVPEQEEIISLVEIGSRSRGGGSGELDLSTQGAFRNHFLNNKANKGKPIDRVLSSADEGIYMSQCDLSKLTQRSEEKEQLSHPDDSNRADPQNTDRLLERGSHSASLAVNGDDFPPSTTPAGVSNTSNLFETESRWQTVRKILGHCFQPPVIGALLGLFCAVTPIRSIFVDLNDRDGDALLQPLFDGLYAIGQTAVPINMMILGCNLSASQLTPVVTQNDVRVGLLSEKTMIGIVIGKMILMPIIGILSSLILKYYVLSIPDDIDGAFYLVMMIVFLTPTANNVMVMVELSGSGSGAKEGMARVIAWQYAVAPVILSLTMTFVISIAGD